MNFHPLNLIGWTRFVRVEWRAAWYQFQMDRQFKRTGKLYKPINDYLEHAEREHDKQMAILKGNDGV